MGNHADPALCMLEGVPDGMGVQYYRLVKGEAAKAYYPSDASLQLKDKYAGIKLSSLLGNTEGYLVLHEEAVALVQAAVPSGIEYLPLRIIGHNGRVLSDAYYIVNPLGTYDVLHPSSEVEYFDDAKDLVVGIDRIVLDAKAAGAAPALFRLKEDPFVLILQEALADTLRASCTNILLTPIEAVEDRAA